MTTTPPAAPQPKRHLTEAEQQTMKRALKKSTRLITEGAAPQPFIVGHALIGLGLAALCFSDIVASALLMLGTITITLTLLHGEDIDAKRE